MNRLLVLLVLTGCGKVPAHLQVQAPSADAVDRRVTDGASAVALLGRRDPLVRAPMVPDRPSAAALTTEPWLVAWMDGTLALERQQGDPDAGLEALEAQWPGTPVVALTRGQRLRLVETALARSQTLDDATEIQVAGWLTPLRPDQADVGLPRKPLDWFATPDELPTAARAWGERWVIVGWLDSPEIPVPALLPAITAPMYDGLRATPMGALLLARAQAAAGPVDGPWADLRRATALALEQSSADRDSEQRAWSDHKKAAAAELGAEDPIRFLLERSLAGLTAAAGDDRAAAGALLAHGGLRLRNQCRDAPCVGLDRVEQLATAGAWGTEPAELAAIWRVIALKDAVDRMDVGAESVAFPAAMVDLVDALAGTGAGPMAADLLRVRRGEATTWHNLALALGADGVTDWSGARQALGIHLDREAKDAISRCTDPTLVPLLQRIDVRVRP